MPVVTAVWPTEREVAQHTGCRYQILFNAVKPIKNITCERLVQAHADNEPIVNSPGPFTRADAIRRAGLLAGYVDLLTEADVNDVVAEAGMGSERTAYWQSQTSLLFKRTNASGVLVLNEKRFAGRHQQDRCGLIAVLMWITGDDLVASSAGYPQLRRFVRLGSYCASDLARYLSGTPQVFTCLCRQTEVSLQHAGMSLTAANMLGTLGGDCESHCRKYVALESLVGRGAPLPEGAPAAEAGEPDEPDDSDDSLPDDDAQHDECLEVAARANEINTGGYDHGIIVRPAAILRLLAETSRQRVATSEWIECMLETFGAAPAPDEQTSRMRRFSAVHKRLMAYATLLYEAVCIGEVVLGLALRQRTTTALTVDEKEGIFMRGGDDERRQRINAALTAYSVVEPVASSAYNRTSVMGTTSLLPNVEVVARVSNMLVHGGDGRDDFSTHDCCALVMQLTTGVVKTGEMSLRVADVQGLLCAPDSRDRILEVLWQSGADESYASPTPATDGEQTPAQAREALVACAKLPSGQPFSLTNAPRDGLLASTATRSTFDTLVDWGARRQEFAMSSDDESEPDAATDESEEDEKDGDDEDDEESLESSDNDDRGSEESYDGSLSFRDAEERDRELASDSDDYGVESPDDEDDDVDHAAGHVIKRRRK